MKLLLAIAFTASSINVLAAVKTYQVTGPILEINDSTIVVQKGKEKWEISQDASTKKAGELKVGSKVAIQYSMKATEIEAKEDKKATKK